VPLSRADGIPRGNYEDANKAADSVVWSDYAEKVTDLWNEWMPLHSQLTLLSPQRSHPISPTVPFPSYMERLAAGEVTLTNHIEPGGGMLGGNLHELTPPPLASRQAGLLGKRARRG